jgi:hypothetical protein
MGLLSRLLLKFCFTLTPLLKHGLGCSRQERLAADGSMTTPFSAQCPPILWYWYWFSRIFARQARGPARTQAQPVPPTDAKVSTDAFVQ